MNYKDLKNYLESNNYSLIDFDKKSNITIYINDKQEFVVSLAIEQDKQIFLQDSNYFDELIDAANTYEDRKDNLSELTDIEKREVLKKEIKKIERNISDIETSLEKIERLIETFSPNLFGVNGYLDELKQLENQKNQLKDHDEKIESIDSSIEKLVLNVKNLIGVDIREIVNSQDIIDKAKEMHKVIKADLSSYKTNLNNAIKEFESLTQSDVLPYASDNLRALIAAESPTQQLEQ